MIGVRALVAGQIGFFACVAAEVAIRPRGLGANHGISYYGTHPETLPYFIASFIVAAASCLAASAALPKAGASRIVARCLVLMAILMVGVAVTPITFNIHFHQAHLFCGITLFSVELLLGLWLAVVVGRSGANLALWAIQAGASFVALMSLLNWKVEIQSQIVAQLAFSVLLDRTLIAMLPEKQP